MRIRRRFTILWTVICLAIFALLVSTARTPAEPGCFEYCSLNADVARGMMVIVVAVWLIVAVVANGLWWLATTTPCPRCGRRVDPAVSSCPACSYDLRGGRPPGAGDPPSKTG